MAGRHTRARPSNKRLTQWIGVNLVDFAVPASTAVLVGSLNAAALALRPFTIVRTRLLAWWSSDQIVAQETPMGAFGAIVASEAAVTAGVGSIPTPIIEPNADFFVYQPLIVDFTFITAAGYHPDSGHQYTIDSKAMRKVDIDDDVAFIMEEQNANGALAGLMGRMLVKLH